MSKLRAAVIGAGYFGRLHAVKLAANPDVELVAVADLDAARAGSVARETGCRPVHDFRELIGNIDIASVTVPTESHHALARPLIEAGVHVLVEKPIAKTLEQADDLVGLAAARDTVLAVGHQERFNPAFMALRAEPSRALFVEAERLTEFRGRGTDVDIVLDLMIHDLDLVLSLVGSEPVHVSACGFSVLTDALDIANARLEFASGCVANISASRVSQSPVRKLRVFQTDAYISADLQGARLRSVRRSATAASGVVVAEQSFERADALGAAIAAFVSAVRTGNAPPVDGVAGRRALKLALEIGELVRVRLERLFPSGEVSAA
ncbi:MAG: Gfo/Idh/MocA family protein [Burkholderiales bacterium]